MIQQGQVFKLQARCAGGERLWAYRYRIAGRVFGEASVGRVQAARLDAQRALQNKLTRLPVVAAARQRKQRLTRSKPKAL